MRTCHEERGEEEGHWSRVQHSGDTQTVIVEPGPGETPRVWAEHRTQELSDLINKDMRKYEILRLRFASLATLDMGRRELGKMKNEDTNQIQRLFVSRR